MFLNEMQGNLLLSDSKSATSISDDNSNDNKDNKENESPIDKEEKEPLEEEKEEKEEKREKEENENKNFHFALSCSVINLETLNLLCNDPISIVYSAKGNISWDIPLYILFACLKIDC